MDIKNYTQKILNAYSSFIKDKVLEKDIDQWSKMIKK